MKKKKTSSWKIILFIGILLILVGIGFYFLPIFLESEYLPPNGRLSSAQSSHFSTSQLDWYVNLHTEPQEIVIRYRTDMIEEKNGFLAFFIPYSGVLTKGEDWKFNRFDDSSTLLYKEFTCNSGNFCNYDEEEIVFQLNGEINQYRTFKNHIQIPVDRNPVHSDAVKLINKISNNTNFDYGWDETTIATLKVTLPSNIYEWDERPTSGLEVFTKNDGTNHNVLKWDINDNSLLQIEYIESNDWFLSQNYSTLTAVLITLGAALMIASFESKKSSASIQNLSSSIALTESNIGKALSEITTMVKDDYVLRKERKNTISRNLKKNLTTLRFFVHKNLELIKLWQKENDSIKKEKRSRAIQYGFSDILYSLRRLNEIKNISFDVFEYKLTEQIDFILNDVESKPIFELSVNKCYFTHDSHGLFDLINYMLSDINHILESDPDSFESNYKLEKQLKVEPGGFLVPVLAVLEKIPGKRLSHDPSLIMQELMAPTIFYNLEEKYSKLKNLEGII